MSRVLFDITTVPSGSAELRKVTIGRNNGLLAEVKEGLEANTVVVLYPGPSLVDGIKVARREIE